MAFLNILNFTLKYVCFFCPSVSVCTMCIHCVDQKMALKPPELELEPAVIHFGVLEANSRPLQKE